MEREGEVGQCTIQEELGGERRIREVPPVLSVVGTAHGNHQTVNAVSERVRSTTEPLLV